jgi:proteic killer suppression protein
VITRFKHKGLQRLYHKGEAAGLRRDLVPKITRILSVLDAADGPGALDLPGYRLHPLKGEYKGFWSVTVNGNWRIIFRFAGPDAIDVELIDYH